MRIITGFFWGKCFSFCCCFSAYAAPATLAVGEQRSISVDPGVRFSIGNGEVIQVKATGVGAGGGLLLVKGKSQGYSDLVILGAEGVRKVLSFRVVSKKQAAFSEDGKRLMFQSPGLRVAPRGDGWVAKGGIRSLEDWNLLWGMQQQSKGKFQSLTRLHPMERLKAQSGIAKLFRSAGLTHLRVKGAGNSVFLEGNCATKEEKELAEDLAHQVFMGVRSHLRIPFESGGRLRFRARILEVIRSEARSLGLNWEEGVPSALVVGKTFTKANFSLQAALKMMEKMGHAKLLSNPQLLLNERGVAELKVGGEIPIQLQSKESASVIWKPYGLYLKIELPGINEGVARAKITVEVSTLDPNNGSDGVPGLRISRMDTQVDMNIGQPILLSGLIEKRQSRGENSIPFLGDVPILGELFRSEDFRENRSELVILLQASEVNQ